MELPDKFTFKYTGYENSIFTATRVVNYWEVTWNSNPHQLPYKTAFHNCEVVRMLEEGRWIMQECQKEVKLKPHKHAELIKLWADGAKIQYEHRDGVWADETTPSWNEFKNYRVKPQEERKLELNFSVNEKQAKLLLTALNKSVVDLRVYDWLDLEDWDNCTEAFWGGSTPVVKQLKEFLGV